jgi:hypothetical protein
MEHITSAFDPEATQTQLRGMASHKFKIGQRVSYQPLGNKFATWCVVTALLPERDRDFNIKFVAELIP